MTALIWCPFADEDSAATVATRLLDERLVACANILGPTRSLYEWNGIRSDEREVGVLFKTDSSLLDAAVTRISELHPYDTPAVLGWHCDAASGGAAAWLGALAG